MVVPREVVYEKFRVPRIVKSYSRIPDVIELPPLVQIQVDSYKVFIDFADSGLHRQPAGDALLGLPLRRAKVLAGGVP